jgi:hypothetical protein
MNCSIVYLCSAVALALCLETRSDSYHVRYDGNDSFDGKSIERAWKTINQVNQRTFKGGDRVLFAGGQTFPGNIVLRRSAGVEEKKTILLTSYGAGRATIAAGLAAGIVAENSGYVEIENLILQGGGPTENNGDGVLVDNTLTNGVTLEHVGIRNVEVKGFGKQGIRVGGSDRGFKHVRISDCVVHENLKGGMEVAGRLSWTATHYAHADVQVRNCLAFNNSGDPQLHTSHSGSGIVLYQVDGGEVDHCSAWNNGSLCPASGGGPVGIWTCSSRKVVIQHCESFGNKTKGLDGGGFDIDGGSEQCVLQYNYSHDNAGPGLMVYTYPYAPFPDKDNIVRFNITVNDAINSDRYAGIWVRADGKKMKGVQIYNNTVINQGRLAAFVNGDGVEAAFKNNILMSGSKGTPLHAQEVTGGIKFENNLYWTGDKAFRLSWNGKNYSALSDWRKQEGQEMSQGKAVGFFIEPSIPSSRDNRPVDRPSNPELLASYCPENELVLTNGGTIPQNSGFLPDPTDILKHNLKAVPLGAIAAATP